jgi:hypothetical protein
MEFCPLCYKESLPTDVEGPMGRLFHLCENCKLVFESKSNRPDWNEEKIATSNTITAFTRKGM